MEFYKCDVCGNTIFKMEDSGVKVVCCGENMKVMLVNDDDKGAKEKHVPVVIKDGHIICVRVGEDIHPSTVDHYIKWILVKTNKGHHHKQLSSGDRPEACFYLGANEEVEEVYAYCNIHGLWERKINKECAK